MLGTRFRMVYQVIRALRLQGCDMLLLQKTELALDAITGNGAYDEFDYSAWYGRMDKEVILSVFLGNKSLELDIDYDGYYLSRGNESEFSFFETFEEFVPALHKAVKWLQADEKETGK